jgi:hypothetical protein
MLRKELVVATNNVIKSIESSGIALIIRNVVGRDKKSSSEEILSSYQHSPYSFSKLPAFATASCLRGYLQRTRHHTIA